LNCTKRSILVMRSTYHAGTTPWRMRNEYPYAPVYGPSAAPAAVSARDPHRRMFARQISIGVRSPSATRSKLKPAPLDLLQEAPEQTPNGSPHQRARRNKQMNNSVCQSCKDRGAIGVPAARRVRGFWLCACSAIERPSCFETDGFVRAENIGFGVWLGWGVCYLGGLGILQRILQSWLQHSRNFFFETSSK